MLTLKIQHPQDVIARCYMLDYLREIGAKKVRETLAGRVEGIFYTYTLEEGGEEQVDFNWELLMFTLPVKELNLIMSFIEPLVWEVEQQQGKIIAQESAKKLEGGKPVDINLMAYAQAKLAERRGKILGLDGKPLDNNRGIL